jgi:hypothetical protein
MRRPLMRAGMFGGAGYAIGARYRSGPPPFAPGVNGSRGAASQANRTDALTKLKSLLDLGVLTQEQHDSELARLLEGDVGIRDGQVGLGPVQLLVIAFAEGSFEVRILDELRRLRERDAVRMLDLLFVAKDERGHVAQARRSDLTVQEAAKFGALAGALIGLGGDDEEQARAGRAAGVGLANGNGPLLDAADMWCVADVIPAGAAAAIALVEHRWAIPLRDAIDAAGGHDLVDSWVHPEDLIAIGADRA